MRAASFVPAETSRQHRGVPRLLRHRLARGLRPLRAAAGDDKDRPKRLTDFFAFEGDDKPSPSPSAQTTAAWPESSKDPSPSTSSNTLHMDSAWPASPLESTRSEDVAPAPLPPPFSDSPKEEDPWGGTAMGTPTDPERPRFSWESGDETEAKGPPTSPSVPPAWDAPRPKFHSDAWPSEPSPQAPGPVSSTPPRATANPPPPQSPPQQPFVAPDRQTRPSPGSPASPAGDEWAAGSWASSYGSYEASDWGPGPSASATDWEAAPRAPYPGMGWERASRERKSQPSGPPPPPSTPKDAYARAGYTQDGSGIKLPFKLPDLSQFFNMGTEDLDYEYQGRGGYGPGGYAQPQPGYGAPQASPAYADPYNRQQQQQQQQREPQATWAPPDYFSQGGPKANISLLTRDERVRVLPPFYAPLGSQYEFFRGDNSDMLQRAGLGLAIGALFSKFALLGAGAFTFPLWSPWFQAIGKNFPLSQFPYVGIWQCRVLEVYETEGPSKNFDDVESALGIGRPRPRMSRSIRVVVGDDSGAETEITVPWRLEFLRLKVGEPAELLVLSKRREMDRFKAIREVYLPLSSTWVAEYPFVRRDVFRSISYALERERMVASQYQQQYQQQAQASGNYYSAGQWPTQAPGPGGVRTGGPDGSDFPAGSGSVSGGSVPPGPQY